MVQKSLNKFKYLFLLAFFILPAQGLAQSDVEADEAQTRYSFLDDHTFRAGLHLGGALDPNRFILVATGEYALERYFTLGPTLQVGFGNDSQFWSPTIGGRYRFPIHALERWEFSIHSSAGFIARRALSRTFYNFNMAFGADLEVFIMRELSLGLGVILNVTSSSTERTIMVLHAGVTYHL